MTLEIHCNHSGITARGTDDPGQQELRGDDKRHELHRLKLGAGEGTTQQAQADTEDGVGDRNDEDPDRAARGVEAQHPERHDARQGRLRGRCDRERCPVSRQQVESAQRLVRIRSKVPEARSRCIVMDVIRNITSSGNTPSRIRHALLNADGAPGRVGTFWNMKYISVMMRLGTSSIIATVRWSAAS